jgi:hypothetical protein
VFFSIGKFFPFFIRKSILRKSNKNKKTTAKITTTEEKNKANIGRRDLQVVDSVNVVAESPIISPLYIPEKRVQGHEKPRQQPEKSVILNKYAHEVQLKL